MEDSLQLPDQDNQVLDLLSPHPLEQTGPVPRQHPHSRQTTPPHSLAYSNSTGLKERTQEIQLRSPVCFQESPAKMGLIKANNENYPLNQQKTVPTSPAVLEEVREVVACRSQYKKLQGKVRSGSRSPVRNQARKVSPSPAVTQRNNSNGSFSGQNRKKYQMGGQNQVQSGNNDAFILLEERKTIDKSKIYQKQQQSQNSRPKQNQQQPLQKKVADLEQALHLQTVLSEQLRTKLSVTNSLLESKLKDHGLSYLLSLKNSSRQSKNIDIYVQLTIIQKQLLQKNIIIDRLKNQFKQLSLDHERLKIQHQKRIRQKSPSPSPSPHRPSPNKTLNEQLQRMMEQKQALIDYIQDQKLTMKRKMDNIQQLQQQLNRMSDRSVHYKEVERPKLVEELTGLKMANRELKEELEREKMESGLVKITGEAERKSLEEKINALEGTVREQEGFIKQFQIQRQEREKEQLRKQESVLERCSIGFQKQATTNKKYLKSDLQTAEIEIQKEDSFLPSLKHQCLTLKSDKDILSSRIKQLEQTVCSQQKTIKQCEQQIEEMRVREAQLQIKRVNFDKEGINSEMRQIQYELLGNQKGKLQRRVRELQGANQQKQLRIRQFEKQRRQEEEERSREKSRSQVRVSESGVQKQDTEFAVYKAECHLLKNERDHYMQKYGQLTSQTAQLYCLKLKLSLLQQTHPDIFALT